MKPRLWILAVLAGIIWLAILIQHDIVRVPAVLSVAPEKAQEIESRPPSQSPAESSGLLSATASLTTTATPADQTQIVTPTASRTPIPLYHEVKPGDVPGSIAAEYGVSVALLMNVNDISDATTLQIGQKLRIPVTVTATPAISSTSETSSSPTPTPIFHTIQPGEVLLAIAAEYDTTVEAIMITNDIIDPRTLQIGQKLLVPPDRGSILGVPTKIHEIQRGDTLLSLAALYGSTLEDILVTNPDLEPDQLQIGQRVIIPLTHPKFDPETNPIRPRLTSPTTLSPEFTTLAQAMIEAVNSERQAHGLPALMVDEQLILAAQTHGQDMVTRAYFSHVTPEGITLEDRLQEYGLEPGWAGENIQRNVQGRSETIQYAMNWFMSSRIHRNNILHDHYDRFGVSVTEGPPGWYTYVLVFTGE